MKKSDCGECEALRLERFTCRKCRKSSRISKTGYCLRCLFVAVQTGEVDPTPVEDPVPIDGCAFDMETSCCARAKSNFFRVRDIEVFRSFCWEWGIKLLQGPDWCCEKHQLVGLSFPHGVPATWEDVQFSDYLAEHLADGTVVVIEQIQWNAGHLDAWSMAVNSEGKTVYLDIADIYDQAEALGVIEHRGQEMDREPEEGWQWN